MNKINEKDHIKDMNDMKLNKDEIYKITNELKSHYYMEEFFVDPDKKFIGLLEKIIVNIII
jgi:hypothetical protein